MNDNKPNVEQSHSQVAIQDRIEQVQKALDAAGLVGDELTLTALGKILVNACIVAGVAKKQFFQITKDDWRTFSSMHQARKAGIDFTTTRLESSEREPNEELAAVQTGAEAGANESESETRES